MGFQLAQVIKPQFVSSSAAALTLMTSTGNSPTTGTTVPAQVQLSLWTCRFVNVTSSPVTLKVWRVTAGGADTTQWEAVHPITIPVATFANPYFEWDPHYQMVFGDAIWALAGTASAISVSGDGGITT